MLKTKSEMKAELRSIREELDSLKRLVRSGSDPLQDRVRLLRDQAKALLADLALAGDRKTLEAWVWRRTHADFRGHVGAPCRENRTILVFRTGTGTCLVSLSSLTVAELLERA